MGGRPADDSLMRGRAGRAARSRLPTIEARGEQRLGAAMHGANDDGAERGGARPLVLVAEDDEVNQRVCVEILKRLGYDTLVVGNGLQALAAFEPGRFVAVLMDCMMPELDGYTATGELRRRYPEHRVPIIAVTANSMVGDRDRCLEAGMDGYVAKPIRLEDLAAAMACWVSAPAAAPTGRVGGAVDGVLDIELLRELGLLDPAEGEQPLAEVFATMTAAKLAELRAAIAACSTERQRAAAHALKGAAANLGARMLSSIAAGLEQQARAGDLASAEAVDACAVECARVVDALHSLSAA